LVNLSPDFAKSIETLCLKTNSFFDKSESEKKLFEYPPNFGFVSNNFKEAFRWLSGPLLFKDELPFSLANDVTTISAFFDSFFKNLIFTISEKYFEFSSSDVGNIFKIPLLSTEEKDKRGKTKKNNFGMFDIVRYKTNKVNREFLVNAHVDPGLFSFSVYSSISGLEMLDISTNKWVSIPTNKGVIWCGSTAIEASNGAFKGGWHRVQHNKYAQRTTMWYEVCIKEQINDENYENGMKKVADNMLIDNDYKDMRVRLGASPQRTLIPVKIQGPNNDQLTIKIRPDAKVYELKQALEMERGISMSKSGFSGGGGLRPMKNSKLLSDYLKDPNDYSIQLKSGYEASKKIEQKKDILRKKK